MCGGEKAAAKEGQRLTRLTAARMASVPVRSSSQSFHANLANSAEGQEAQRTEWAPFPITGFTYKMKSSLNLVKLVPIGHWVGGLFSQKSCVSILSPSQRLCLQIHAKDEVSVPGKQVRRLVKRRIQEPNFSDSNPTSAWRVVKLFDCYLPQFPHRQNMHTIISTS